jgi:hypothetical protein
MTQMSLFDLDPAMVEETDRQWATAPSQLLVQQLHDLYPNERLIAFYTWEKLPVYIYSILHHPNGHYKMGIWNKEYFEGPYRDPVTQGAGYAWAREDSWHKDIIHQALTSYRPPHTWHWMNEEEKGKLFTWCQYVMGGCHDIESV